MPLIFLNFEHHENLVFISHKLLGYRLVIGLSREITFVSNEEAISNLRRAVDSHTAARPFDDCGHGLGWLTLERRQHRRDNRPNDIDELLARRLYMKGDGGLECLNPGIRMLKEGLQRGV